MTDILAIGAHPDDVELCAGGTLISHKKKGFSTGILDLTRGEMGTRGTPEIRDQEAADAAKILGLDIRENLGFKDVFFENDEEHRMELIKRIRKYQPKIVLANAPEDRHPDHGRASRLIEDSCFWAGLEKIKTTDENGNSQAPYRPEKVYHYIQSRSLTPDFYVDISDVYEQRTEAYKAYKSQLFDPKSDEPETYISSSDFFSMLEARAREFGNRIGVKYAEGFIYRGFIGVSDLSDLK